MLLRKIKEFHKKTMEAYRAEELEKLSDWKKEVLRIHEDSDFLFYYEDYLLDDLRENLMIVKGDHVKGKLPKNSILYLYDGEGLPLGDAVLLSDPREEEAQRKGFLTPRRNEFEMKLLHWRGKKIRELDRGEYLQCLNDLQISLSLISDRNSKEK